MNSLLTDPNAFATPLLLYGYSIIGSDIFELEPETIRQILEKEAKGIPQCNFNRLNAALGLFSSNLFWVDPITFGLTCRTLNRAGRLDTAAPDIDDIMWGVSESRVIYGNPETREEPYSEAVKAYIQELLRLDSIVTEVPTLDFIKPETKPDPYDDSEQRLSIFQTSKDAVNSMEGDVGVKMVTMLKQIKDLRMDISREAAADLEKLLEGK